ncbi:MAG: hypothetical protein V4516_17910, partial [Pseudomonadota bacterium]
MDIAALRAAHPDHWMRAAAIRTLTLDAVAAANSGHSGMPMGMADVATVLFEKHLNSGNVLSKFFASFFTTAGARMSSPEFFVKEKESTFVGLSLP